MRYSSFLLGLANQPILSREQTLEALHAYRDGLSKRQNQVANRAEAQRPLPAHVEMMFDYSLMMISAETNWLEMAIEKFRKEKK